MSAAKRPASGWLYLAAFIAVGLSLSTLGPALTYLRGRAHVSKGDIGALFVAQSAGYLFGSIVCGRLYDRGHGHRAMSIALVGIALSVAALPHTASVAATAVPVALIGAFAACVDVGGNTLVVWFSRGTGSGRLLNALHLFFGIGALLSPGLVNRSLAWTGGLGLVAGVLAVYSIVVAIAIHRHDAPLHDADDHAVVDIALGAGEPFAPTPTPVQTPRPILAVIGVFFFLYVSVEIGFSGWIKTYAEGIHLPGANSPTWLNTAFWLSFTTGRAVAVVLARRVRPGTMLVASCGLMTALLLVMSLADGSAGAVWVVTPLIAFSVAPQFATMIAYAEEHIVLSGRSTSWFVSASGLGGLVLPFVIGRLLDGSSSAMPIAVGCCAAAVTLWLVVVRRALVQHRGVPAELVHELV